MNLIQELRHAPEFVKLSHSVFALPFALASLFLAARGAPEARTLWLVVGAVVTARLAAMAFNRVVDARLDAANPRTAGRHLPAGKISRATAWAIVTAGALLFILISAAINTLAAMLSPLALAVVFGYSFTKRFTRYSHFVLGAALGLAPLGAWVAMRAELGDVAPWLLALAVTCWVAGFDMIYALQDVEFDRAHGLHSMPAAVGATRSLWLVRALHLIMLAILLVIGLILRLGWPYFAGLTLVLASLTWEQWLLRQPDSRKLQLAFLQANGLASFGYLAAVLLGLFIR
ncbi:MAG: UbiA family prenyltransferase [Verrucomicrobia bacterium]|nr:UbiA family prenyltransferase [Verrucomicrobiota bacterium]